MESIAKIASPKPLNLVERFWLQSLAQELLPGERVAECLRVIAPFHSTVEVAQNPATKRAHYRNLVVCSRVWQCPVCASTITESRRKDITHAVERSGLCAVMVTYTLSHRLGDSLPEMLTATLEAYRALKSGKAWAEFTVEHGWIGSIRSLEVTYGANGWHPHIHELALLERENTAASEDALVRWLKEHWIKVLRRQGKSADWKHGVNLTSERSQIADYVAKYGHEPVAIRWTVEHELTKAPVKRANPEGRTPLQLLADYGVGDKNAGRLYVQYANAFKGRNQLVWSRGLRERLGMGKDKLDEEIMKQQIAEGVTILSLSREEWNVILSSRKRGELLQIANEGNIDKLNKFVIDILDKEAN